MKIIHVIPYKGKHQAYWKDEGALGSPEPFGPLFKTKEAITKYIETAKATDHIRRHGWKFKE
jgi:hypothetical protein